MKLSGKNAKKFEYIIDTFKGTCGLNNYNLIKVPIKDERGNFRKSQIDEILKDRTSYEKVFFYGPIFAKSESIELGALSTKSDTYTDGEIIDMAVKFLEHLGLEEVTVDIKGDEELAENLETLDIVTTSSDDIKLGKDDVVYDIYVEDEVVIKGYANRREGISYFTVNYDTLAKREDYIIEEIPLDAYIVPKTDDVKSDAFVIASNLKDAGFKIEVDYNGNNDTSYATYLITFDSKDIKEYKAKITDTKTKETQEVGIDSIIEILAFM